jgi:hypothetical protein
MTNKDRKPIEKIEAGIIIENNNDSENVKPKKTPQKLKKQVYDVLDVKK